MSSTSIQQIEEVKMKYNSYLSDEEIEGEEIQYVEKRCLALMSYFH